VQRIRFASALVLIFNVCGVSAWGADAPGQAPCPKVGYITDRLVPNAQVAEAIYRAVAIGQYRGIFRQYPIVTVEDAKDHWNVWQTSEKPDLGTFGGGQLSMSIDKCSGAISQAHYNR
jgi:hypothetical protein